MLPPSQLLSLRKLKGLGSCEPEDRDGDQYILVPVSPRGVLWPPQCSIGRHPTPSPLVGTPPCAVMVSARRPPGKLLVGPLESLDVLGEML